MHDCLVALTFEEACQHFHFCQVLLLLFLQWIDQQVFLDSHELFNCRTLFLEFLSAFERIGMRANHYHSGARNTILDGRQPEVDLGVVRAIFVLAQVERKEVQGPFRQENMVRDVVFLLAREVIYSAKTMRSQGASAQEHVNQGADSVSE